jgi:hypothetical protein
VLNLGSTPVPIVICHLSVKRKGRHRRVRKPSFSVEYFLFLSSRITRFPARKRIVVYHGSETWNNFDCKNSISYVDTRIAGVENIIEGVVILGTYTSKRIAVGCTGCFCEKEGWIMEALY